MPARDRTTDVVALDRGRTWPSWRFRLALACNHFCARGERGESRGWLVKRAEVARLLGELMRAGLRVQEVH